MNRMELADALDSMAGSSMWSMEDACSLMEQAAAALRAGVPDGWERVAADAVIGVLESRRGFDGWWGDIDEETSDEILDDLAAVILEQSAPQPPEGEPQEVPCSKHPLAPHGFNRNASHTEDRYVCDCEGWLPDEAAQ